MREEETQRQMEEAKSVVARIKKDAGKRRMIEGNEKSEPAGTGEHYFPAAFASEPTDPEPRKFDFANNVYETHSLSCKLLGDVSIPEGKGALQNQLFRTGDQLQNALLRWYQDYICFLDSTPSRKTKQSVQHARRGIDKLELFSLSGTPVPDNLKTGNQQHDIPLARVRIDRFGNVMCWNAPAWSDLSVQLTHGFPKKIIRAAHGGYTPENLICTSKASNQMIRALAFKDIFSTAPQKLVSKTGMTVGDLTFARSRAVTIHTGKKSTMNYRLMELMYR